MDNKNSEMIIDHNLCMKCLGKKATHVYRIHNRGYGSEFDGMGLSFQCCDECNEYEYTNWFNEKSEEVDGEEVLSEKYQCEKHILELIHSLPMMSQKLLLQEDLTENLPTKQVQGGVLKTVLLMPLICLLNKAKQKFMS